MNQVPLYDTFSAQYDFFVNWPQRLQVEMPFIEAQLRAAGARRVLDVACGTGQHSIALAQRGYQVTGADLSTGMLERARANVAAAGCAAQFVLAGFGQLADHVPGGFDALLCLGNSLPHVLTQEALAAALTDFAAVLRQDGLLLVQSRNFDAVLAAGARWLPPQAHSQDDQEWLFVRFYDFNSDGTLTFNVLTLHRAGGQGWQQHTEATVLRPWCQAELSSALTAAGFGDLTCYGDMQGTPFDVTNSGDLVIVARKL